MLAWFGAGIYFATKVLQGFFVVELSLNVAASRVRSATQSVDYVFISVDLKRGIQGAFRMHDAVVIVAQGATQQVLKLGIERFQSHRQGKVYVINTRSFAKEVPTINLAPGDETCLAAMAEVIGSEPCRVDVVVIGTKFLSWKRAQWRASTISPPTQS